MSFISNIRSMMPWNLLRVVRKQQLTIEMLLNDHASLALEFEQLRGALHELEEEVDKIDTSVEFGDEEFCHSVEAVIENYDFTNEVTNIIENWEDFSDTVDEVLDNMNWEQKIEEKVEDAVSAAIKEELLSELNDLMSEQGEDIVRNTLREVLASL